MNISTGDVTLLGNAGVTLTDIAFSPSGQLYGATFSSFYSINTATGKASLIGSLGGTISNALVFSSDGTLYSAYGDLDTINPSNGLATRVGSLSPYTSGGDLAFVNSQLLLATTSNQLVSVNTDTGAPTLIGDLGIGDVYGLASPDGRTLYGVAGTSVYKIDPDTGAATFLVNYGGQGLGQAGGESFYTEARSSPTPTPTPTPMAVTPEPTTILMFGTGLIGLTGALRRRCFPIAD